MPGDEDEDKRTTIQIDERDKNFVDVAQEMCKCYGLDEVNSRLNEMDDVDVEMDNFSKGETVKICSAVLKSLLEKGVIGGDKDAD